MKKSDIKMQKKRVNGRNKKVIFVMMELLFIAVVPFILVMLQYGNMGSTMREVSFKISFTGILMLVVIFLIVRRVFLKKRLERLSIKIAENENNMRIKTDGKELENIARELANARTIEVVLNAIMPLLLLSLCVIMCKGLESSLVKLSGSLGFILISFMVGMVFSVLSARTV